MNKVEPIKVVHLASGDLWAGAEIQLYYLATALSKRADVQVHVVLLNHGTLELKLRESNVAVSVVDESQKGQISILYSMLKLLRNIRPQIVHTHRQKENVIGSIAALFVGAISVRTVHGKPEHAISAVQYRKKLYQLSDYLCGRYLQRAIVAVSEDLSENLGKLFPPGRIAVILNAIDALNVRRLAEEKIPVRKSNKQIHIGIVGRLVPVKRIDIFIEIAARLNSRYPGQYAFTIIGDGPLRQDFQDLIHARQLDESVEMLGFKENPLPYIRQFDTLVITSDSEGLPMTLLEAMCLEIPVVARAVGGIPEVLCYGKYGELINSDNAEEFSNVLSTYINNASEFINKARQARVYFLDKYTIENSANEHVTLYKRMLEKCIWQ